MEQLASCIPDWVTLSSDSPEPVVYSQCALVRNIRDFVFPDCCIDDERRAIEARFRGLLKNNTLMAPGEYHVVSDMDNLTMRFLAERRLITYEMLCAVGPRGVYVTHGQSLTVMVNAADHLTLRATAPGGKIRNAWERVNTVDDALGNLLDFSYHDRLGYLTRSLHMVGTGLRVGVLLHLPGLAMTRLLHAIEMRMAKQRLHLCGMMPGDPRVPASTSGDMLPGSVYGLTATVEPATCQCLYMDILGGMALPLSNAAGNLFLLTNMDTLGLSESEIVFQVEQAVSEIVAEEEEARRQLMRSQGGVLLDSIGRALGIAGSARQLGMGEALMLASLIRLAETQGHMTGLDRNALNQLLLECQGAHLQILRGTASNPQALASERATLFRNLLSGTAIN
jgi:protein arginine kinase